jgi:beta-glucanase (GH16 family)
VDLAMRFGLLTCLLLAPICSTAFGDEPPAAKSNGWELVWQDEFNEKELSPKKWNVLTREQSKHNERQYYLPDEVYLHDGCLRLRSRKRDFAKQHFTSGRVDTSGKFSPVYGRFEIRGRLPGGKGLWPAYWLYPQNRDWAMERLMADTVAAGKERTIPEDRPWYSEIDIMEFLGHEKNVLYGTLHYHTFDGEKKSTSGTYKGSTDFTKDFHTYVLEWEPGQIIWFIDGQVIHKTNVGIPHTPHYFILNTAVGGVWPGDPDESTSFPQYHDIDYVRVYARKNYFEAGE